jgi:hypothetical protein
VGFSVKPLNCQDTLSRYGKKESRVEKLYPTSELPQSPLMPLKFRPTIMWWIYHNFDSYSQIKSQVLSVFHNIPPKKMLGYSLPPNILTAPIIAPVIKQMTKTVDKLKNKHSVSAIAETAPYIGDVFGTADNNTSCRFPKIIPATSNVTNIETMKIINP